jgi:hypothetical protein
MNRVAWSTSARLAISGALLCVMAMIFTAGTQASVIHETGVRNSRVVTVAAAQDAGCGDKLPFDYCCQIDRGDCGGNVVVLARHSAIAFDDRPAAPLPAPATGDGVRPSTPHRPPRP